MSKFIKDEDRKKAAIILFWAVRQNPTRGTVAELAKAIKMHPQTVWSALAGVNMPSRSAFKRWVTVFPALDGLLKYSGEFLGGLSDSGTSLYNALMQHGDAIPFSRGVLPRLIKEAAKNTPRPLAKTKPHTNGNVRVRISRDLLRSDVPSAVEIGVGLGVLATVCSNSQRWHDMLESAHKKGMSLDQVVKSIRTAREIRPSAQAETTVY